MLTHLRRSVVMAVICLVFFGFVYALAGTGVAQLLFQHQADGSITANGSTLIGQNWSRSVPGHRSAAASSTAGPTTPGPTPPTPRTTSPAATTRWWPTG